VREIIRVTPQGEKEEALKCLKTSNNQLGGVDDYKASAICYAIQGIVHALLYIAMVMERKS